jgi:hypothetical protein
MSIAWYIPFQIPLLTPHFTLSFLLSDNTVADVASKQQTAALFLSTIVTRTKKHTELTKKTDKPDGKPLLCQRTFISVFRAVFYTVKLHSLTYSVWSPLYRTATLTLMTSGMQQIGTCWVMMIHHTHSHTDECVPGKLEISNLNYTE